MEGGTLELASWNMLPVIDKALQVWGMSRMSSLLTNHFLVEKAKALFQEGEPLYKWGMSQ